MLVAVLVDAPVLLGEVEGPVGVEVAVGDQCPEFPHPVAGALDRQTQRRVQRVQVRTTQGLRRIRSLDELP